MGATISSEILPVNHETGNSNSSVITRTNTSVIVSRTEDLDRDESALDLRDKLD